MGSILSIVLALDAIPPVDGFGSFDEEVDEKVYENESFVNRKEIEDYITYYYNPDICITCFHFKPYQQRFHPPMFWNYKVGHYCFREDNKLVCERLKQEEFLNRQQMLLNGVDIDDFHYE